MVTPDTPVGTINDLFVSNDSGAPSRNILLRFPNIIGPNSGQIPAGATIISATLQLTLWNTGDAVSAYQLLEDWDEATATWNSRGMGLGVWTNPGGGPSLSRSTTLESTNTSTGSSGGIKTLDIAQAVQAWSIILP